MKNNSYVSPMRAVINYCNRLFSAGQDQPVIQKQVTSADIQAYRKYLASYRRHSALS